MRKDSYDSAAYEAWLNDKGTSEDTRCVATVMEAWATTRENLPGQNGGGEELKEFPESTTEIASDIQDMCDADLQTINRWMRMHGFGMTTMDDGTIKWAIWRDISPMM